MDTIGILGGTFNPIHLGHIQIGVCAHEQFDIPHILVMPSGEPSSYKDTSGLASADDRCAMAAIAISRYPYMTLSTLEIERIGHTYTSDTLAILKNTYSKIYFMIGADSLFALESWHDPAFVMANCHILAANRDRHGAGELEAQADLLRHKYGACIDFIDMPDMNISSSDIRRRIGEGLSVEGMLDEGVYEYIVKHDLYKDI